MLRKKSILFSKVIKSYRLLYNPAKLSGRGYIKKHDKPYMEKKAKKLELGAEKKSLQEHIYLTGSNKVSTVDKCPVDKSSHVRKILSNGFLDRKTM